MKSGSILAQFAGILALTASSAACEFDSYLEGVVRTPGDKCAAADEVAVPGTTVQLNCPPGSSAKATGNGSATSDENGQFEIVLVGPDALPTCRLRVQRDGYKPVDTLLSELGLRKDPNRHARVFVTIRLQRSSAVR